MTSITSLLVLDTNVCLDLFVFHDPRWDILLSGLATGKLKAVTNKGCRDEWLAVLHYQHLPVNDENRPTIINAFDQLIELINPTPLTQIRLPVCTDPDDQQFMELARDCRATHLITKDKALLKCAKRVAKLSSFQILQPEAFLKNADFLFLR
jgi:putative PIN family toxin of toxin-antitoxin system